MEKINEQELKFEKYELPKSTAFASEVFFKSMRGEKYFPKDTMGNLEIIIKEEKTLFKDFFDEYCEKFSSDKEWLKNELLSRGYTFNTNKFYFTESAKHWMNSEIDNDIIPFLENGCGIRAVCETLNK